MKKIGLVLAAVAAIAFGTASTSTPVKADPVTVILVGGGLGWGWCHATYGQKRTTPWCSWHDSWHKQYWGKRR